jgi:peptidoglycan/LPS O-acetylase OafA/YrhL
VNSEPTRTPALDGLRGIAILLVIPHNSDTFATFKDWAFPFAFVAHIGWTGVQLFFVLSGFLITSNLLDSRGSNNYYLAFYARRVLRIFPLYFLVLIGFLLILPRLIQLSPAILDTYQHQIWLWFFLSNWVQPFHGTVSWFGHFWSLAVEEQFYLVWPFVIALTPARRMLAATLVVAGLAVVTRIVLFKAGFAANVIYMLTATRMDALALGAAAAVLARRTEVLGTFRIHQSRLAAIAFGLALLSAIISHAFNTHDPGTIFIGYTLLAAAGAMLILVLHAGRGSGNWLERTLSVAPLRSCGKYSYAMYVFHMLIIQTFGPILDRTCEAAGKLQPVLYSLSIILVSYAFGSLSYHLYERHFLALKRYFVPNVMKFAPTTDANRDD